MSQAVPQPYSFTRGSWEGPLPATTAFIIVRPKDDALHAPVVIHSPDQSPLSGYGPLSGLFGEGSTPMGIGMTLFDTTLYQTGSIDESLVWVGQNIYHDLLSAMDDRFVLDVHRRSRTVMEAVIEPNDYESLRTSWSNTFDPYTYLAWKQDLQPKDYIHQIQSRTRLPWHITRMTVHAFDHEVGTFLLHHKQTRAQDRVHAYARFSGMPEDKASVVVSTYLDHGLDLKY